MRLCVLLVLARCSVGLPACAQSTGSVSGTVRDAMSGVPLPGVPVSATSSPGGVVSTVSDAQGRYSLRDVPAGQARLNAGGMPGPDPFAGSATKVIQLAAGQELRSVDFPMQGMGAVSGKVTDGDGNPVAGANVMLVTREYALGALRYSVWVMAHTDKQGEYGRGGVNFWFAGPGRTFQEDAARFALSRELTVLQASLHGGDKNSGLPAGIPVDAGRVYVAAAWKDGPLIAKPGDQPIPMEERKPILAPVWYLGSRDMAGASPLTVAPREHREHLDFRLESVPSYCIEGNEPNGGSPEALRFGVTLSDARFAQAPGVAVALMKSLDNASGAPNRFRVCNLPAGQYRLTSFVQPQSGGVPIGFRSEVVTVTDRDVTGLALAGEGFVSMAGEVAWDGAPPGDTGLAAVTVQLRPLTRDAIKGESESVKTAVPGTFSFDSLLPDEYAVRISGVPAGAYVKDVTYGGQSVLHAPLRPGSGTAMRITLARDGGRIAAQVADADANPVADAYVVVMPEGVISEVTLADTMVLGRTDQSGAWTSGLLAPGKYVVLARQAPVDRSPECIGQLFRSRGKARSADPGPGATVTVRLEP